MVSKMRTGLHGITYLGQGRPDRGDEEAISSLDWVNSCVLRLSIPEGSILEMCTV
jgi:hypothetical protein